MNLRTGLGIKYQLLFLPRHKSRINVRTGKLNITHKSNSRVWIVNLATFATTTYISYKRDKKYKLKIRHEYKSRVEGLNPHSHTNVTKCKLHIIH